MTAADFFRLHIAGLEQTAAAIGPEFDQAVALIQQALEGQGRVVLTGVGKSFLIARKIAGTFNSTGTPAATLHATEARHGDLGLVHHGDVVIALSFSGESEEVRDLLPLLRQRGARLIAITRCADNALGSEADIVLCVPIEREACLFNLAPTTSAIATLALGDTLALLVAQARKFSREDYAALHPAGAIGNSLTPLAAIMRTGDRLATVTADTTVYDALQAMTSRKGGAVAILSKPPESTLVGIITDGDIRRALASLTENKSKPAFLESPVSMMMTPDPLTLTTTDTVADAWELFTRAAVDDILILDESRTLVGLVDLQDLPKIKGFSS